jgi:16S rRNA (cytosine1402-N4)-methyltransferase
MILQAFINGNGLSSPMASLPLVLATVANHASLLSRNNHRRRLYITRFANESPLESIFDDAYSGNVEEESIGASEIQPTRRIRYNGKYPRNFGDKYKELSDDETTVQKVLSKGITPAGRHIPILLNECLDHLGLLETREGPTFYVDCTLGYGGHSSEVLRRLLKQGNTDNQMVCFDRDPVEISKATERLYQIVDEHDSQLDINPVTTVNRNFREVRSFLETRRDVGKVTALLADLGLSSMQIDDAARGFTYKREGPLDMRMAGNDSSNNTESAYDLLSRLTVKQFTKMLEENSDEEHAATIAQAVLGNASKKKKQPNINIPSTTVELANMVRDAVRPLISPPLPKNQNELDPPRRDSTKVKKELDSTVARVMQAIRIEVNSEFESLEELLNDLPHILAPGGRAVMLTFHSGEDRRVKSAFKTGFKDGVYSSWSRDVVRPTTEERRNNPRSSCCKLRWVVRSDKK